MTVEYGRGVVGRQQAVLKAEMPHDVLIQPPREEWGAQDIQASPLTPSLQALTPFLTHISDTSLHLLSVSACGGCVGDQSAGRPPLSAQRQEDGASHPLGGPIRAAVAPGID